MKYLLLCVTLALCVLVTVGQRRPNPPGMNVRFEPVTAPRWWSPYVQSVVRHQGFNLFNASRLSALVHVAMHDTAWNYDTSSFSAFASHASPPDRSCHESAIAGAVVTVLTEYAPAHQLRLLTVNRFYYQWVRRARNPTLGNLDRDAGYAYGAQVAQDIIDARLFDGYDAPNSFVLETDPPLGQFRCDCTTPVGTTWGQATPWVVDAASYVPTGNVGYNNNDLYPTDFLEIIGKGVYSSSRRRLTSSLPIRTGIETFVATFFSNEQYTSTVVGHVLDTLQGILRRQRSALDYQREARLLALTSLAMADATIVSYLNKYNFLDWSPETGIAFANVDQYDSTSSTGTWEPLGPTPQAPSFISDHGAIAGSLAAVWEDFFGRDEFQFTARSEAIPGVEVTYDSFSQYAIDIANSRIYFGVDWRSSSLSGANIGFLVGQAVVQNALN